MSISLSDAEKTLDEVKQTIAGESLESQARILSLAVTLGKLAKTNEGILAMCLVMAELELKAYQAQQ